MSKEAKRIGVVGCGPVGLILAAYLKEAGCNVMICDRAMEKINLIRKEGVTLDGLVKKHLYFNSVYSSVDELMEQGPEIIFFAVKANHMQSVLPAFSALPINPKLSVVCAQNGIDVEKIAANVFTEAQTLRMVLNFAGNLHAPNVVNVTFFNPPNYIASMDDSRTEVAQWIGNTLTAVALETEALSSFRITDKIWEKTILNASMSPLCGISRLTMKEAMSFSDTIDTVEQIIIEGIEVAKAEEIKFPENFVKLCLRYLKRAGHHFPSMAVDMINNRETEIEYFNGKIVEYGKKHYIRTPLNLTFTNLVRAASYKNALTREDQKSFSETIVDF
ncbi:MAG: ketopantoate reductase family protein [Bacteroidia bacterium]